MQHKIEVEKYGPLGPLMTEAIESCVHCGFCLPACPTYQVQGEEMDSPRGRILLMKSVLEGALETEAALPYLDRCLGCLGCVTACPSGVEYGNLITPFRMITEETRQRSPADRFFRRLTLETLPYPKRFRLASAFGRLAKPFRGIMPERLRAMLDLLPTSAAKSEPLPAVYHAEGKRRARVALLAGCAQQVLSPEINWATLRVLAKNGIEVVIPKNQGCCGALAAHTGAVGQAQAFAKASLRAFPSDVDAILTNAAGCGSGMKEYGMWLRGEPEEAEAEAFAGRVQDVSVFLARLGMEQPPSPLSAPALVAYHDACHLAHAQKVVSEPRQLLMQVPNLRLVDIPDGEICCGSAGTYNIEQPTIAQELGRRKAAAIRATGAEIVVTGNIGCLMQIQSHLRQSGKPLEVLHTMQLLDRAYQAGYN